MPVTIDGTSGVNTPSLTTSGSTVPVNGLYLPTTNTLGLATNSVERVRIDASGNLGIGTSSPAQKLDVAGQIRGVDRYYFKRASDNYSLSFVARWDGSTGSPLTGTPGIYTVLGSEEASSGVIFAPSNTERMRLDSSGNLGIGVTPTASSNTGILQNQGGILFAFSNTFQDLSQNAYYNGGYRYTNSNFATLYRQNGGVHQWFNSASGTAGNLITFTQAMTLDASGRLQLGGTAKGNYGWLTLGNTSDTGSTLQFLASSSSGSNIQFGDATSGSGEYSGYINYSHSSDAMIFATATAERARIDSSGNLGLGVVPSGWGSAWRAIQLGTQAAWYTNNDFSRLSLNVYGDSVYTERYLQTDHASQYIQASGNHTFMGADSGTAGNAITWTTMLNFKKDNTVALQGANFVAGTGITFPATQSASSDANTLDDYEEGTWTPALKFGGNSTGMTISATGKYTKIGNVVYWTCDFVLTAKGSSTGSATITGLPFTSFNGTYSPAVVWAYDMSSLTGSIIYRVTTNATTIDIYQYDATGSNNALTQANFNNASQNRAAGFYFV